MDFSGVPLETARLVLVLTCLTILMFAPFVEGRRVAEAEVVEGDGRSDVGPPLTLGDPARVQPCRSLLATSRLADFSPPSESCRYKLRVRR